MRVISWSRNNDSARAAAIGAQAVPLDELLATSDVISLHVRLNDATRHMIGAEQFARMKRGAIVINTARGGVIDEDALLTCIAERTESPARVSTCSRASRCRPVIRSSRWTMS